MNLLAELRDRDATGLAALIAAGEISAAELREATLERIDASEAQVNAIAVDLRERARGQTIAPGPFAGVPFLLKDLHQGYAGARDTMGACALKDRVAASNSFYVERCLRAGLVIIGTTTTPELGLKATTETILHGTTRNPWNLDHTPGGSSGGAAAAVAAGYVPMAGASDGGGSIRIPAAYCGLFGLKPSRGRVSEGPVLGEGWEGAVCSHVLTRSVRDSAGMLDVLAGTEPGDPFALARPERPFAAAIGAGPGRLRIGFSTRSPIGGAVGDEMIAAVHQAGRTLEALGHEVVEAEPAIDGAALARCYMGLYFGHVAAMVAAIRRETGCAVSAFHSDTNALALLGRSLSAGAYVELRNQWNGFARALAEFHARYDLFMTPTTALGPARIGALETGRATQVMADLIGRIGAGTLLLKSGIVDQLSFRNLERTPFTQLANLAFVPAMSVPLHFGPDGLPVGVQFVGRFGAEAVLLQLAAQLEEAAPWSGVRPARF